MNKDLSVICSQEINASTTKVWDILTNPEKVKEYMFGTELICSWEIGSPIVFQGEYDGQQYKDTGTVLAYEENKTLKYSYWSSFSGMEDKAENYATLCYELLPLGAGTSLQITQQGFASEEARTHSENNWKMLLDTIKKMAE